MVQEKHDYLNQQPKVDHIFLCLTFHTNKLLYYSFSVTHLVITAFIAIYAVSKQAFALHMAKRPFLYFFPLCFQFMPFAPFNQPSIVVLVQSVMLNTNRMSRLIYSAGLCLLIGRICIYSSKKKFRVSENKIFIILYNLIFFNK